MDLLITIGSGNQRWTNKLPSDNSANKLISRFVVSCTTINTFYINLLVLFNRICFAYIDTAGCTWMMVISRIASQNKRFENIPSHPGYSCVHVRFARLNIWQNTRKDMTRIDMGCIWVNFASVLSLDSWLLGVKPARNYLDKSKI